VVGEFLQEFKTLHGAITCTGLLGYNMSDPQQFAQAKTHKIAKERCPAFVRDAVKLIEKVLQFSGAYAGRANRECGARER
jgi:hypothetical protein